MTQPDRTKAFSKSVLMTGVTALVCISILSGCGLQALLPQTPAATSAPAEANPAAPAASDGEQSPQTAPAALPTAADARQTVQDFLTAVQLDPNSAIATQLLTPLLSQQASGGEGLQANLLKTTEKFPTFEVSAAQLNADGQTAVVEATLFTQKPANIGFTLVSADGKWKINEIRPMAAGDYPTTPEGVVQAFLIAYMERPDSMSSYLTSARRGSLPPGGSVGMLQILGPLEGVLVKSAVINPEEPPQAAIVVMIKAGSIDAQRQFILTRENDRWGIDQIMTVQ